MIEKCRVNLAAGNNLTIFPEGTRSVPGEPLDSQRGFAHIATLTGVNLQPVTITCEPITLVKRAPYIDPRFPAQLSNRSRGPRIRLLDGIQLARLNTQVRICI